MRTALILAAAAAAVVVALPATAAKKPGPRDAMKKKGTVTLQVKRSQFGNVLFDGKGRVLYAYSTDRRGKPSRCYGVCAREWPVYFAKGKLVAGKGLKQKLIGKVKRRNGRFQVTYNGWPLYYYAHEGPGEVKCHNVTIHGGTWWVVRPNGRPLTSN